MIKINNKDLAMRIYGMNNIRTIAEDLNTDIFYIYQIIAGKRRPKVKEYVDEMIRHERNVALSLIGRHVTSMITRHIQHGMNLQTDIEVDAGIQRQNRKDLFDLYASSFGQKAPEQDINLHDMPEKLLTFEEREKIILEQAERIKKQNEQ